MYSLLLLFAFMPFRVQKKEQEKVTPQSRLSEAVQTGGVFVSLQHLIPPITTTMLSGTK